ncbi:hypothetical protein FHR84_000578 [Actinopolyspora biskrensis]|uniref:Uncharacterized protein n=1 Tax=Actinopolyspora biskrensis TaxID=1470178 RepID=A0A852YPR1_9ACTN|nr:hypothetical protein [Actinopolyspora biskrensis]NYH77264.1 hypothetical protein [Actinopolyspora biskrensis]
MSGGLPARLDSIPDGAPTASVAAPSPRNAAEFGVTRHTIYRHRESTSQQ